MRLTHRQCLALSAALTALDGDLQPVRDKNGDAIGMERRPMPLPWKVAYAVGKTIAALRGTLDAIDRARLAIVSEASDGKGKVDEDSPRFAESMRRLAEMHDAEADVSVHTIREAELEACKLPPSVIAGMLPIIVE